MHLFVHAGAGLELLHHHLGGTQASVHLPQQHLVRVAPAGESEEMMEEKTAYYLGVSSTYLPKPAAPNLLQVEQTVAAHHRGLEELD